MAYRKRDKTCGQAIGKALGVGSGKPRKSRREEPDRGKVWAGKNAYGMNRIRARLKTTSQSWIASIILVLNLVKLAVEALLCLSFLAWPIRNYLLIAGMEWAREEVKTKNQFRFKSGLVLRICRF
ncbi:hypothetical protein [Anditalea andensis]|uniref:Transposase DDE domain-containing protein n=1 Tax=Anditalea andensis TaxID=1048983 RepID=A0A074KS08_9BACT|nr:hypothetical protein [Anditalea andensis]KEO72741.1 hypothetical protein EL17_18605 [Anditalea andensis]